MNTYLKPLVSIITPSFNAARFIKSTILSVQAQTYAQWEMIIVDDCSSDNTCEIVEQLAVLDKRLHLIKQNINNGPALARNVALDAAKGRYIAFLDSDDLWLPDKLNRQLLFMQKRNIAFSYTQYRHIDEAGNEHGALIVPLDYYDYSKLLKNNKIGCLTVMLDRDQIGNIAFKQTYREDYVLWLELIKRGFRAYGLQEYHARYRIVTKSHSRNKIKASIGNWRVYRNVEKLSLPNAVWCFMNYAVRGYIKNRR